MPEKTLWDEFLEENDIDVQKVMFNIGINGLANSFINWLYRLSAIDYSALEEFKKMKYKEI
jgi:hypothetical protein